MLAVVSLIALYFIIFLTVQPAFAWHCQQQIDDVADATDQQREAIQNLDDAVVKVWEIHYPPDIETDEKYLTMQPEPRK